MTFKKRTIVVLLGMHRSGTSVTMSVLNALGVRCGNSLIPAGRGNETGFWEHAEIVATHEQLLADLNRVWHGPTGSYPMPAGWLQSRAAQRAKHRLAQIVEGEIKGLDGGIWGFKDPRTCRLLPMWSEVFEELQVEPQYILSVRNPAAVCASLMKHNRMGRDRSQLVWLQHNLETLHHCGSRILLVSDFDRLIERTREEVERLASVLARLFPIGQNEKNAAAARVSPGMRRSSVAGSPAANAIVAQAYRGLAAMARDEEPDQAFVDVVATFPEAQRLFQPWQRERSHTLLDWTVRMMVQRKYR